MPMQAHVTASPSQKMANRPARWDRVAAASGRNRFPSECGRRRCGSGSPDGGAADTRGEAIATHRNASHRHAVAVTPCKEGVARVGLRVAGRRGRCRGRRGRSRLRLSVPA
jgi:hypothetical protein